VIPHGGVEDEEDLAGAGVYGYGAAADAEVGGEVEGSGGCHVLAAGGWWSRVLCVSDYYYAFLPVLVGHACVHYDDGSGDDSLIAKWKFKVLTRRKRFIFVGLVEKD
jgi:hypothetical protein